MDKVAAICDSDFFKTEDLNILCDIQGERFPVRAYVCMNFADFRYLMGIVYF